MHIMIAGQWRWPQYEAAFARGLEEAGVRVTELSLADYGTGLAGRVQQSLPVASPMAFAAGRAILAAAQRERPDHVLFWRPTHPLRSTLAALRSEGIGSISYNNDDPFSERLLGLGSWRTRRMWRLYEQALPFFDRNYFYRDINVAEGLARGARHAAVMLPYFMPWQDRPVEISAQDAARFGSDMCFIGHFEDDGRDGDLLELARRGHHVRVWGDDTWAASQLAALPHGLAPIVPALGEDYTRALCAAKICLCYMSKLNRDGYTRRCFEIPAVGSVMLAERTPALTALFREDEEACFFASRAELVEKVERLLTDHDFRNRVAQAGLRRVWQDGHDVTSRARQFAAQLKAGGEA